MPVASLTEDYNRNHYVDWFIDELGVVIELHGKQHYGISNFGNIAYSEAVKAYNNIRYRDNLKKEALTKAGFEYREISYKLKGKITPIMLKQIIFNDQQELS